MAQDITPISVEDLTPVAYKGKPVITTVVLAAVYGTRPTNIQTNYAANAQRFVEGKHLFRVAGQELTSLRISQAALQISAKTRALVLWTARGAARHAKMLDTEQAWDMFERLEDAYFLPLENRIPVRAHTRRRPSASPTPATDALLPPAQCAAVMLRLNALTCLFRPTSDPGLRVDGVRLALQGADHHGRRDPRFVPVIDPQDPLGESRMTAEDRRAWQEMRMFLLRRQEEMPPLPTPATHHAEWDDHDTVADLLASMRFRRDEMYQPMLITPAQAEGLYQTGRIGPRQWARLSNHIVNREGRPS